MKYCIPLKNPLNKTSRSTLWLEMKCCNFCTPLRPGKGRATRACLSLVHLHCEHWSQTCFFAVAAEVLLRETSLKDFQLLIKCTYYGVYWSQIVWKLATALMFPGLPYSSYSMNPWNIPFFAAESNKTSDPNFMQNIGATLPIYEGSDRQDVMSRSAMQWHLLSQPIYRHSMLMHPDVTQMFALFSISVDRPSFQKHGTISAVCCMYACMHS